MSGSSYDPGAADDLIDDYRGVIIEESLGDRTVLGEVRLEATRVEEVTEEHATPWLEKWTLHEVEVPEETAAAVAEALSHSLDAEHPGSWYADFKNEARHYVIFPGKVFEIDPTSQAEYDAVRDYGISIGIPVHQVDFHPAVEDWER